MKLYAPGAVLGETFGTYAGASGGSVAADSSPAPSASLVRNGVVDGAVTLTVAAVAGKTGIYHVSGTIPAGYAVGDLVDVVGTIAVGGVTVNIPVASFRLDQQVSVVEGLVNTLLTRLTSGRASNLDFLDASVNAVGVVASSAASSAATAAAQATTAATQSTNAAASAASADTKATTILNRLGAWTGTGINTILGALRALAGKAAGLTPTDISAGGTFDNTTDSAEAIRDRGDAAWGAGGSITPPIAYYEGRLTLTADEAGIDGRIVRYAGDPLQIAVQMRTATGPINVDGYTLVPSMVDSANADAGALTTTVQLASEGDLLIDGTAPAARGIYRITCRLGAGGQTYGPLLLEVI